MLFRSVRDVEGRQALARMSLAAGENLKVKSAAAPLGADSKGARGGSAVGRPQHRFMAGADPWPGGGGSRVVQTLTARGMSRPDGDPGNALLSMAVAATDFFNAISLECFDTCNAKVYSVTCTGHISCSMECLAD